MKFDNPFDYLAEQLNAINSKLTFLQRQLKNESNHTNDQELFITIQQASEVVHEKVNTLYARTSQKPIPFYKVGKRVMFRKSELLLWMEQEGRSSPSGLSIKK